MYKALLKCERWYGEWLISLKQFNAANRAIRMVRPDTLKITARPEGDGNTMWLTYIAERYTVTITPYKMTISNGREADEAALSDTFDYITLLEKAFSNAECQAQVQTIHALCSFIPCDMKWVDDCCILTSIQEGAKIVIRVGVDSTSVELYSGDGELLESALDKATTGVISIVREIDNFIAAARESVSRPVKRSSYFSSGTNQSQNEEDNPGDTLELIARKDAMEAIHSVSFHLECPDHIVRKLYHAVASLPAVDAQPVVQGEWKINPDGYYPYCSRCGTEPPERAMTSFCPNCGLKMYKPDLGV